MKPILTEDNELTAILAVTERRKFQQVRDLAKIVAKIQPKLGQPVVEAIDELLAELVGDERPRS